jgi:hypothetical protein
MFIVLNQMERQRGLFPSLQEYRSLFGMTRERVDG